MKNLLKIFIFVIFVIAIIYFGFKLNRTINYRLSYKQIVIETIKENVKENVKEDCLIKK